MTDLMVRVYESPEEQALHYFQMEALAQETGKDMAEVVRVYEDILTRLQDGAHVRSYVPLLAVRRTREALSNPVLALRNAQRALPGEERSRAA
jgi:hypothetical protein